MAEDRSKLDEVQQRRKAYNPCENAAEIIQKNTLVDKQFSRMCLTYNACGCVTEIKYIHEFVPEVNWVDVVADSCCSLDGKYFLLTSAKQATNYYLWYCTNCVANDPAPACRTGIKVCIQTGDLAPVVALATQQQIDLNSDFCATVLGCRITITNADVGIACAASDFNTGFTFTHVTEGCNRITKTAAFTYDCCANVSRIDTT